ncbi:hypothetical protein [Embleya hyalina]|nr:hypothetical protein [Embleya hyalina]
MTNAPTASRPGRRPAVLLVVAVALSWLLTLAAYFAHAAVILPFVFLFGVVSLLRCGTTLMDRLVPALVVIFGAVCIGGLVFSVWPWGLHPVAVGGVGLSLLCAVAVLTGRRPEMPAFGTTSDLFLAGFTTIAALAVVEPFVGRDATGRLSLLVVAEDLARHFALYDSIREVGGYTFLHHSELGVMLPDELTAYPQGSHLAMGLFDNFLRSGTGMGSAQSGFDHFVVYYIATFVFMIFAVLWSIRWIAGPRLSVWRYLAVGSGVAAYLYFGDGTAMFVRGFSSEFIGLGLLAITGAITARPFPRLREQVCMLSALVISVSFVYYLLLPLAGVMVLIWLVLHREELRKQWLWTAIATVFTFALSLVVPLANWKYTSDAETLNSGGGISPVNRHLLTLLLFVVGFAFANRAAWRDPVRRVAGLWTVAAAAAVVLMFLYQTAMVGETSYYYEKLLHQLIVVALIALGGTTLVAPAPSEPVEGAPVRVPHAVTPISAVVLSLALVAGIAANANPDREVWRKPSRDLSWGVAFFARRFEELKLAKAVTATMRAKPADDRVNFLQFKDNWQANYFSTLWVDALSRNLGLAWPKKPPYGSHNQESPKELTARILKYKDVPIRVITNDPETLNTVQRLRTERPELRLEVLFTNPSLCVYDLRPQPVLPPGAKPAPIPTIPYPQNGCKSPAKGAKK